MNFNQFLLLGLTIDEGCEAHIRKNLEEGTIYPFFRFFKDFDLKNPSLDDFEPLPVDFFLDINLLKEKKDLYSEYKTVLQLTGEKQSPIVSVSAIVGKNGSGKSSLVDVVIRLINNMSYVLSEKYNVEHNFSFIKGIRASLYYSYGDTLFCLCQKGDKKNDLKLKSWDKGNWIDIEITKKNVSSFFFYSVFVNYSIHAFNINDYKQDIGLVTNKNEDWLDACFHKNDGYLTPLVLNPKRTNGNIDINIENHLAKSRLLALMFKSIDVKEKKGKKRKKTFKKEKNETNPYLYINNSLSISKIALKLDERSVNEKFDNEFKIWEESRLQFNNEIKDFIVTTVIEAWESRYKVSSVRDNLYDLACKYLVYKTLSIVRTYDTFENFAALTLSSNENSISSHESRDEWRMRIFKLIKEIDEDSSHITFRLKQTLAFLFFRHYNIKKNAETDISIDQFSHILVDYNIPNKWDLKLLVPPPIFDTNIYVKDNQTGEEFLFTQLSSGERQLVYAVSTIIYHLRNLNSVPQNIRRIKYRHVNIILDEIELYFHPGYQRKFVKYLLTCLEMVHLEEIWSLNVIIITHSPFILSDIPKSNVLFLNEGSPDFEMQENTFASNIHSLLQNGFFMEDGTIGEFAREKVNKLFRQLQGPFYKEDDNRDYRDIIRKEILIVSEPILRSQLLKMYNERYGTLNSIDSMRKEIISLRKELESLRHDKNQ